MILGQRVGETDCSLIGPNGRGKADRCFRSSDDKTADLVERLGLQPLPAMRIGELSTRQRKRALLAPATSRTSSWRRKLAGDLSGRETGVRQMVVVVFGDEEHPVDERQTLPEARVQAGVAQIVLRDALEPIHERGASCAQPLEDRRDRDGVMARLLGAPVAHVRGREDLGTREELREAAVVESVEVREMPDVLLRGPLVSGPRRKARRRDLPRERFGAQRRSAQPLEH
jgi:hypothetical protein